MVVVCCAVAVIVARCALCVVLGGGVFFRVRYAFVLFVGFVFVVYRRLFVVRCVLFVVCCLFVVVCCLLSCWRLALFIVDCRLAFVLSSLIAFVVCVSLVVVCCCSLCILYCSLLVCVGGFVFGCCLVWHRGLLFVVVCFVLFVLL